MAWVEPLYSRSQVKRAGEWLRAQDTPINTEVIKNWRTSHGYPLHHFYISLKTRARKVNPNSFVSQRLKRLPSIHAKLRRERAMQLTTMQDIAGCRSVMPSIKDVQGLISAYSAGESLHEFDHEKDYIKEPKSSGYRSHHLIYRYKSATQTAFEDMRVEIQIRSALQHAWATGLETIDVFTRQALKSSHGQADWERFFILMSAAFAVKEKCPPVPGAPSGKELLQEICHLRETLQVTKRLKSYKSFRQILGFKELQKPDLVLLRMEVRDEKSIIKVQGFATNETDEAYAEYYKAEAEKDSDAVLVSSARTRNLKRAFPNFFADTDVFMREVDAVVENAKD